MNTLESGPPVIRGLRFERGNPTRDRVELDGRRGVPVVYRLDIVEEHGKRNPIVEGVMEDNNKVVFVRGYVTEV